MELSIILMFAGITILGITTIYTLFANVPKMVKFTTSLLFVLGLSVLIYMYQELVTFIQYFVASWSAFGVIISLYKYFKSIKIPQETRTKEINIE